MPDPHDDGVTADDRTDGRCNDCGNPIDGTGWCDACIRVTRAEWRADD